MRGVLCSPVSDLPAGPAPSPFPPSYNLLCWPDKPRVAAWPPVPALAFLEREKARLSQDIHGILDGWEFEPEGLQVRIIVGDDGNEKIQMRIDLGLIQMEMDGRPDGQRPDGFPALLDSYEAKAHDAIVSGAPFSLTADDCALLMREGLQFYHRYLSAFHLERYDLVERDTERNLKLFSFVARHAARQRDKLDFEQYRPYVQMMHTRARATQALKKGEHRAALKRIDEGIKAIRKFLTEYQQQEKEEDCSELRFLLRWRREVERERPLGALERLEQQLELSVELEDYEQAARIRDQIRLLQESTRERG
jgi:UvrB/uvrC motif